MGRLRDERCENGRNGNRMECSGRGQGLMASFMFSSMVLKVGTRKEQYVTVCSLSLSFFLFASATAEGFTGHGTDFFTVLTNFSWSQKCLVERPSIRLTYFIYNIYKIFSLGMDIIFYYRSVYSTYYRVIIS